MLRCSSLIVLSFILLAMFTISNAASYDIYKVLAPRFRRARLMGFDGEMPTTNLQYLLENLKPRFRRSV